MLLSMFLVMNVLSPFYLFRALILSAQSNFTNERIKKDSGTKPNPSLERKMKLSKQNRGDLPVSHVVDCPQPPQQSRVYDTSSKKKTTNQDVQGSNKNSGRTNVSKRSRSSRTALSNAPMHGKLAKNDTDSQPLMVSADSQLTGLPLSQSNLGESNKQTCKQKTHLRGEKLKDAPSSNKLLNKVHKSVDGHNQYTQTRSGRVIKRPAQYWISVKYKQSIKRR